MVCGGLRWFAVFRRTALRVMSKNISNKSTMLSKTLTKVFACVCVCVGGGLLLHYGGGFTYKGSNILLGHQRKLRNQVYSY